jgi:hypothetical protein
VNVALRRSHADRCPPDVIGLAPNRKPRWLVVPERKPWIRRQGSGGASHQCNVVPDNPNRVQRDRRSVCRTRGGREISDNKISSPIAIVLSGSFRAVGRDAHGDVRYKVIYVTLIMTLPTTKTWLVTTPQWRLAQF